LGRKSNMQKMHGAFSDKSLRENASRSQIATLNEPIEPPIVMTCKGRTGANLAPVQVQDDLRGFLSTSGTVPFSWTAPFNLT